MCPDFFSGLWVWECSDTPPIHCSRHVQQSIQLPAGLKCEPVQMAEVVQQKFVLFGGAWFYPRVNAANAVHLSKHYSYCLQNHNRRCRGTPTERHLIAAADDRDKWITNTTAPQYAYIHTYIYYALMPLNTLLEGVAFFSGSVHSVNIIIPKYHCSNVILSVLKLIK